MVKSASFPIFHQLTLQEEGRIVGRAGGLLDGVRHQDDGVFLLQFLQRCLHFAGRDRVQAGGGLVEQDDLRLQGQDARQAQALLLPAGKGDGRVVQAVLDLVPQGCLLQAAFDGFVQRDRRFSPASSSP